MKDADKNETNDSDRLITPEEVIEITGCTMEDLERWARVEKTIPEPIPMGATAEARADSMEVGWLADVIKIIKALMKKEAKMH